MEGRIHDTPAGGSEEVRMKRSGQVAVIALVAAAVVIVAAVRGRKREPAARRADAARNAPVARVPRLVDLGAGKCIPCKAMAPILDQLGTDYAGRLEVTFVDIWQAPDQAT